MVHNDDDNQNTNGNMEVDEMESEEEYSQDDDEEEEEENNDYETLTRQIAEKTDRTKYDPSQNKEERRQIREELRRLSKKMEENKRSLLQADNDGLNEGIQMQNEVYARIKNVSEATIDSKLLVMTADLGAQKARNLKLDNDLFNADEFVSKIKTLGGSRSKLDWTRIGNRAFEYNQRAHTIDFMLGPLSVEKKQRKTVRQVRIIKNKEDLVQPTQLQEGDIAQQENETSANVNQIYKILDENGPINYLEFITNPESFSQSVENMFYVSFLIRNAVAEIDDSSGQPILTTRAPPAPEELAEDLTKKQIIMSLDIPLWKDIIDTYGIRSSIIPTRPRRQQSMTSTRWY
ncbi:Nse4 C-terminal-domain-containing protein [Phascolomyces articulosus]|uniref:Non-structural maintenance of chromosomes element 4 n=1 Tax=Phascolomyces articulosus TaxID=60185 RepID=A0AAD5JYG9_9FUNG|nr:Nse4 C-terminal-domain-containing protein [Phascolomyces articulosus]